MFSSAAREGTTTKSERTRALLRDLALRSFRERGYDATTIRLIATEAGVSVGTTNYHFASKADLVQELYLDVQERDLRAEMLEGCCARFLADNSNARPWATACAQALGAAGTARLRASCAAVTLAACSAALSAR